MALDILKTCNKFGERVLQDLGEPINFLDTRSVQTQNGVPVDTSSKWSNVEDDGTRPEDGSMNLDNHNASDLRASRYYEAVIDINGKGDYTNVQNAINDKKTKIFIRGGTYTLSDNITILYTGTEIIGENKSSVIFNFNSGAYSFSVGTNINDCKISNATIKGSVATTGPIFIGACYRTVVQDILFDTTNTKRHITLTNSYFSQIERCYLPTTLIGIANIGYYNNIEKCYFLFDGTGTGIATSGVTNYAYIEKNYFENIAIGIDSGNGASYIINNVLRTITDKGIYIQTSNGGNGYNVTAVGNNIIGFQSTDYGIYITGDNNYVAGNTVVGSGHCIYLNGFADNNKISNNPLLSTDGSGKDSIYIEAGATNNIITGNDLTSGFTDLGTDTEIANNI